MTTGITEPIEIPTPRIRAAYVVVWTTCIVLVVADLSWVALTDRTIIGLGFALGIPALFGGFAVISMTLPRTSVTATIFETANAFAALFLLSIATAVASYVTLAITPAPIADAALLRADRALGFDWATWTAFIHSHSGIHAVLRRTYELLMTEAVVCVMVLGLRREAEWLISAIAISVILTLAVFALAPAVGHFGPGPTTDAFRGIRSNGFRVVDLGHPLGLVSFPSYHTTLALLLPFSVRRTWIACPSYAFTIVMLASIPGQGGHYVIDMLGGAAVALVAGWSAGMVATKPARALSNRTDPHALSIG